MAEKDEERIYKEIDSDADEKPTDERPVTLRRNPFLPGKETWPQASTDGLTTKQIKDPRLDLEAGVLEFGFARDGGPLPDIGYGLSPLFKQTNDSDLQSIGGHEVNRGERLRSHLDCPPASPSQGDRPKDGVHPVT
ncbi:hypothetical protein F4778DRAFT_781634 [Xylariomycetidae sp. FL2044]|nr:hypothetical protein F4778DRAFT_781634 [Xylariomycetidae sp. FL2044]